MSTDIKVSNNAVPGSPSLSEQSHDTRGASLRTTEINLLSNANSASPDQQDKTFFKLITLKHSVTPLNFLSYLVCVFFSILFIVFLNQIQAFMFAIKFKNTENLGTLSGTFTLYDELVSLVMCLVWGVVSDKISRRWTFSLGFLIVGFSLIMYTVPEKALPDLLLVRLVFALGASAITSMLAAGLADLVGVKNGMTSGIVGMFSGLGAVVSVFVLVPIPNLLDKYTNSPVQSIEYTLYIVGSIALAWGVLNLFLYRKHQKVELLDDRGQKVGLKEELMGMLKNFPIGFKLMFTDMRIGMAYLSGFVARGDTVILTVFISAWIVQNFVSQGLCFVDDPEDISKAKEQCHQAYSLAMAYSGMAQVFALLGAPIIGAMLIKLRPTLVLALSSLLGAIGYFGFGFTNSPYSKMIYLWMCLLGVGEIGTIVTSLSFLSSESVPESSRGIVSGIYSLFGGIGIIVCSRLGGYLFDVWRPGAPFIIMGCFHLLLLVMGTIAYIYERKNARRVTTAIV